MGSVQQPAVIAVLVATTCAAAAFALVRRGLLRTGHAFGPADWVTAARATLACVIAGLVAAYPATPVAWVAGLGIVAVALDGLDGQVARRTGTASGFGARFDMEVDAFLIAVLSVLASLEFGGWVLAIGLARYAFVAASWFAAWMRRPLPYRYWRKVVAAVQGLALLLAVSGLVGSAMATIVLLGALALLIESFGHDVWWLWCHRLDDAPVTAQPAASSTVAVRP